MTPVNVTFLFHFLFFHASVFFATGLAEEALTAAPRTTEADGEAAKHQPQQNLLWVTNDRSHNTNTHPSVSSLTCDLFVL